MPSPAVRRRRAGSAVWAVLLALVGLLIQPVEAAGVEPPPKGLTPALVVPADIAFVLGRAGDAYEISADGDPVPAIGIDGLPAGLHLTDHGDGSATLAGTPTGPAGASTVTITARNAVGVRTELLTVTVNQAPAFVGGFALRFAVGESADLVVRAVGFPAPAITVEGDLPTGLTFTDNGDGTATIGGRPLTLGEVPITLTAVNVVADTTMTATVSVTTSTPHAPRSRPGGRLPR